MKLIVICGGGGKTELVKKYPELFLDIDDFIWSFHNVKYHKELQDAIMSEDVATVSNIYKTIITTSREYLQCQSKIILGHDSIYSEWIGIDLLVELKPSTRLHELNIGTRSPQLKKLSLLNWEKLSNATIYDDWEDFNKIISNYTGYLIH
jgi:hypothetical protein